MSIDNRKPTQLTVREELGTILETYSLKKVLDTFDDSTIRQLLQTYVTPLNIRSLAAAKAEILRQTKYSVDSIISNEKDQAKIWELLQRFLGQTEIAVSIPT